MCNISWQGIPSLRQNQNCDQSRRHWRHRPRHPTTVSILGQILSNSPTLWAVAMAATATSSRLDADLVKRLSGQYELSSVSRLDLRNMDLSDISVLRACTGLVALDLRGNAVSRKLQRPDQQANDRLTRGVMQ